jgi:hypothetical protein
VTWAFARAERPERVLGQSLRIYVDAPGVAPHTEWLGSVESFQAPDYFIQLASPQLVGGSQVTHVSVSARHRGYPVSAAGRRASTAVKGVTSSGLAFLGLVALVRA